MPLLRLETSAALPKDKRKALLAALSKAVAETLGKPEQYVMVTAGQAAMLMSGKAGDGAFVDIRSIGGLSDDVNRKLSQQVCKLLERFPWVLPGPCLPELHERGGLQLGLEREHVRLRAYGPACGQRNLRPDRVGGANAAS